MSRICVNIPRPLIKQLEFDWDIDWRNQSSGVGNDGNSQVVMTKFPRWIGSPAYVFRPEKIRLWRALRAAARGRSAIYRVPMIDCFVVGKGTTARAGIRHSTGQPFSTGQGYAYRPKAVCVGGAAAGSTSVTVTEYDELPIKEGQFLSHDDWPFTVVSKSGLGAEKTLAIEMPLRKAIPDGAEIDLLAHGLFEATDDQMGNPAYGAARFTPVRLSFVEVLNR